MTIECTLDAWLRRLDELGAKPGHVRTLARAVLGRAPRPTEDDERLPKRVREALPELFSFWERAATVATRHPGSDPESERLLLQLSDGQYAESVLLPREGVCVSTQIGCAVGCVFCMTGKSGLVRQLSDAEIVAQVRLARTVRATTKKVVFMGMGEPSHNLRNVLRALRFLAEYGDFGHKNLVLSTVGDDRLFDELFASAVRPALAVSLHTIDEEKRRTLLPRGTRMSVASLLERAGQWARHSGYPVQYEWTLLQGVNDSVEEAERLADALAGQYAMVNYIPVNRIEGAPWTRPAPEQIRALLQVLRSRGIVATARDSAAQDVDGGCGQLRARFLTRAASNDANRSDGTAMRSESSATGRSDSGVANA